MYFNLENEKIIQAVCGRLMLSLNVKSLVCNSATGKTRFLN